jgi:putative Holliday junction resolvase
MGSQAQWVVQYAEQLGTALREMGLEVEMVLWDERLSTERAKEALLSGGRRRRARQARVDAVAAAVILQSYLDRQVESEQNLGANELEDAET